MLFHIRDQDFDFKCFVNTIRSVEGRWHNNMREYYGFVKIRQDTQFVPWIIDSAMLT